MMDDLNRAKARQKLAAKSTIQFDKAKPVYKIPSSMYVSSNIVLNEENIKATEEYLQKAKVFHHLWQPEEELKDIR